MADELSRQRVEDARAAFMGRVKSHRVARKTLSPLTRLSFVDPTKVIPWYLSRLIESTRWKVGGRKVCSIIRGWKIGIAILN